MIRYERTGEFREPRPGEFFECCAADREPRRCLGSGSWPSMWILRRIEESEPVKRKRPGTDEIVEWLRAKLLESDRQANFLLFDDLTEILRRVKIHDELLKRSQLPIGLIAREELAAMLESEG